MTTYLRDVAPGGYWRSPIGETWRVSQFHDSRSILCEREEDGALGVFPANTRVELVEGGAQ